MKSVFYAILYILIAVSEGFSQGTARVSVSFIVPIKVYNYTTHDTEDYDLEMSFLNDSVAFTSQFSDTLYYSHDNSAGPIGKTSLLIIIDTANSILSQVLLESTSHASGHTAFDDIQFAKISNLSLIRVNELRFEASYSGIAFKQQIDSVNKVYFNDPGAGSGATYFAYTVLNEDNSHYKCTIVINFNSIAGVSNPAPAKPRIVYANDSKLLHVSLVQNEYGSPLQIRDILGRIAFELPRVEAQEFSFDPHLSHGYYIVSIGETVASIVVP